VYTGAVQSYHNDFFNVPARSTLAALAANIAFLQGLIAPPFGSNDALWSLAYEFWYYVSFPMLAVAIIGGGSLRSRVLHAFVGVGVLWAVGASIVAYFPIWLAGIVVGLARPSRDVARKLDLWSCGTAGLFGGWLILSHVAAVRTILGNSLWAIDTLTGFVFSALLYVLLHDRRPSARAAYRTIAQHMAHSSYTLYVAHLPFLVFLRAWLVPGLPWAPTSRTILVASVIAVLAFVYAVGVATLTEARTSRIRGIMSAWRSSKRASAALQ
jgi:peptidoglycan/LPS O-acetylase OafA/YrhL